MFACGQHNKLVSWPSGRGMVQWGGRGLNPMEVKGKNC